MKYLPWEVADTAAPPEKPVVVTDWETRSVCVTVYEELTDVDPKIYEALKSRIEKDLTDLFTACIVRAEDKGQS